MPNTNIQNLAGKIPVVLDTQPQYTCHLMMAFTDFYDNLAAACLQMKNDGYTMLEGYTDSYDTKLIRYNGLFYRCIAGSTNKPPTGITTSNTFWQYEAGQVVWFTDWNATSTYAPGNYYKRTINLLNACVSAGIPCMLALHGSHYGIERAQFILDTINHPGMYKLEGKPTYASYIFSKTEYDKTLDILLEAGVPKSKFMFIANTLYPPYIYYAKPPHYNDLDTGGGAGLKNGLNGGESTITHLYNRDSYVDGFLNFSCDKGYSGNTDYEFWNNWENMCLAGGSYKYKKYAFAGITGIYGSVQFVIAAFVGVGYFWNQILALPVEQRPLGVCDNTANDLKELSYVATMPGETVNGLTYIPRRNSGFTLGKDIRYPLLDHTGMQQFARPYFTAFLNKQANITITEEKIFGFYWLHPVNADYVTTMPSQFEGDKTLGKTLADQKAFWATTVFATGYINVAGVNQVNGFKAKGAEMETIYMAVHLTAPAKLKINNTISAIIPAGVGYFQIPQVLGVPYFAILEIDGVTVRKEGFGRYEITQGCFPGGWNPAAIEILNQYD